MARVPPFSDLIATATTSAVHLETRDVYMSGYVRYEHYITDALNIAGGEDIRWLPRRRAGGLLVPANDFWVLDRKLVRFGYFAGTGEFLEHELTDDPGVVRTCAEAFEAVWELATPHADYRPT